jgi:hypothetical protein
LIGVFTFRVIRVWVVGVLPRWGWDGVRGGSCGLVFIVGLYCVDDDLGVGCYLVGGRIADGGKVGLVLGPGLEAACSF